MEYQKKLAAMLEGTHFYFSPNCNDPVLLNNMVNQNTVEYDALEDVKKERIASLIFLILADAILPEAKKRFGDTNDDSIRQLLSIGRHKAMSLGKDITYDLKLEPSVEYAILEHLDQTFQSISDIIADEVARFRLIPPDQRGVLAIALAEMLQEINNGNNSGCN